FLVAVIISGVIAIAVMIRFPELAMRIFPAQSFDIQWGEFYSPYFPLWQTVIVGLLAFVIAFIWMVTRASARMCILACIPPRWQRSRGRSGRRLTSPMNNRNN